MLRKDLEEKARQLIAHPVLTWEWDYEQWKGGNDEKFTNQLDWNPMLIVEINKVAANLGRMAFPQGGVNCILCSPRIKSLISTFEYFNPYSNYLSGRYRVYEVEKIYSNILLVGKESSIFDKDNTDRCCLIIISNMEE